MPVVQIFTIQNSAVIAGTRDKGLKSLRPIMLYEFIGIHHSLAVQIAGIMPTINFATPNVFSVFC
jgi:hypothetical protein